MEFLFRWLFILVHLHGTLILFNSTELATQTSKSIHISPVRSAFHGLFLSQVVNSDTIPDGDTVQKIFFLKQRQKKVDNSEFHNIFPIIGRTVPCPVIPTIPTVTPLLPYPPLPYSPRRGPRTAPAAPSLAPRWPLPVRPAWTRRRRRTSWLL